MPSDRGLTPHCGKGLVQWAREHMRNNEMYAVDEKIAELEDELRRLRARRAALGTRK